jgi:hypothetical protein
VTITRDDFWTVEDLEALKAPKLNIATVDHLIVRDTLRRESLIPRVPACRAEIKPCHRRPSRKPVEHDVFDVGSMALLTTARMSGVMQPMMTMARMSRLISGEPMDSPEIAQVFGVENLMSPDNIIRASPPEDHEPSTTR